MPRYHVGGDFEHIEPMLREAHALEPDNSTISRGLALVLQAYTRARARTNARAHTRARAHARARTHITVLQERAIAWRDDRAAEDAEALLAALADENAADAGVWFDLGAFYDSCRSAGLCVRWAIPGPAHRQANRNRSICVALRCGHRCRAKARRLRTKCLKPRRAAPHRRCLRQTSAAGRGDAREW